MRTSQGAGRGKAAQSSVGFVLFPIRVNNAGMTCYA